MSGKKPREYWSEISALRAENGQLRDRVAELQAELQAELGYTDSIAALKTERMRDLFHELAVICWEGGSLDGGALQGILVKNGILVKTKVEHPCSEWCNCQRNDAVFPTICYRLAPISCQ